MFKKDNWVLKVFIITFILSIIFSSISNFLSNVNIAVMIIVLLLVISIGILFDIIGVAVLSCNESTFHAKASNKIKGAKECIVLIKNSNKVSSICNDVIGDVCGIVSGTLVAALIILLKDDITLNIIFTSIVSSITVGFKAMGKKFAIKRSDDIVFIVGKIIEKFKFKKKQ